MTEFTGEIHPLADFFAMLPDDELQELADDIAVNGLTHPIVLDANGCLIDGRNRLAACERAGVAPAFVTRDDVKTDEQVAALVRSENNRRRNQTTGQQAATDALLLDAMGLRREGRWERDALTQDSALPRGQAEAMRQAGFILDHNRALLLQVAAGSLPISKAYETVKAEQAEAAATAAALDTLRDLAPDLYRYVTEDGMDLDEAHAAYLKRTEEERAEAEARNAAVEKFSRDVYLAVHFLAPLAEHDNRRREVEHDLDLAVGSLPITAESINAAIKSLKFILTTHKESL